MTILNSNIRTFAYSIISLCLAGCWTVRETDHAVPPISSLPAGKETKVRVSGFESTVMTYDMAYTYGTGNVGGWYDYRGCYRSGFGSGMYSSTTYIPRVEETKVYQDRATDLLEHAGCIVKAKDPQYGIEVRFDGPFFESGDAWAEVGWLVCTILTADFQAQSWTAKLRIHDLGTGKLLHEKDIVERDEAVVWGPIPLISPSTSPRTSPGTMKEKCLSALTDKAVAEAIAFLSTK